MARGECEEREEGVSLPLSVTMTAGGGACGVGVERGEGVSP